MPPPPMYNSHYPPHPHCHPQEHYSAPGWHVDNHQYIAHHNEHMGPYPRQFVDHSHQYNQLGSTYQSLPMAQPNSQHMYYPRPSPTMHEVQEHGWHRSHHDQEFYGWDHDKRRDDYQQFPVRSSIQMVNEHVPRKGAEKWHETTHTGDWTHPHNQYNSTCSSSNTTTSSSSTTTRTGLSKEERIEYTALIKDLWRSARFAQEFKKYSVGDYVRVKELLDRLSHKDRTL